MKDRLGWAPGRSQDPPRSRQTRPFKEPSKGILHVHASSPARDRRRRTRHSPLRHRHRACRDHAEDLAPVPRRHHRQGRFPRPALPHVRRRSRQAQQRRHRGRNLSELLADEDQRAVLRDAQGRARHRAVSDALCRRRSAGDQYRPDARPRHHLRPGHALEEGAGRQGAHRLPRRQGHRPPELGVAGRRRRQPLQADRRRRKMPRA